MPNVIDKLTDALGIGNVICFDRFADLAGGNRVIGALQHNSVYDSAFEADWSTSRLDNVNPPFQEFKRVVGCCESARDANSDYNCFLWMQERGPAFTEFVTRSDGTWRLLGAFMPGCQLFTKSAATPFSWIRRAPLELKVKTYAFTLNGPLFADYKSHTLRDQFEKFSENPCKQLLTIFPRKDKYNNCLTTCSGCGASKRKS